jgi:acyl carrier protein
MAHESAVAARIRSALAEHLKRDLDKVRPQDELRKDLGLDSLAMIELLFKIEETFDLEIPNDDLSKITTVGDVIAYVEVRLSGAAPTAPAAPARFEVAAARPAPPVAAAPKRRVPAAKETGKRPAAKSKGSRRA